MISFVEISIIPVGFIIVSFIFCFLIFGFLEEKYNFESSSISSKNKIFAMRVRALVYCGIPLVVIGLYFLLLFDSYKNYSSDQQAQEDLVYDTISNIPFDDLKNGYILDKTYKITVSQDNLEFPDDKIIFINSNIMTKKFKEKINVEKISDNGLSLITSKIKD